MLFLPSPSSNLTLTEYFTVYSRQEMDLAPVIARDFMRYKFFLHFSSLSRESSDPVGSATG